MKHLTEQQIAAMAPNASAVANAKKIVKSGGLHTWPAPPTTPFTWETAGEAEVPFTAYPSIS